MLSDFLFSLLLFFSFLVVMTYFFRNFNSSLRILNSTYLIVYLFLILLGDIIILFLFSMMGYSFSLIITVTFKFFLIYIQLLTTCISSSRNGHYENFPIHVGKSSGTVIVQVLFRQLRHHGCRFPLIYTWHYS